MPEDDNNNHNQYRPVVFKVQKPKVGVLKDVCVKVSVRITKCLHNAKCLLTNKGPLIFDLVNEL